MRALFFVLMAFVALVTGLCAVQAEPAAPLNTLAQMPVKEVTVFKDGHAFVLHEGAMPTDAQGNVLMDYLPVPVLGTFWAYSADKNVRLASAIANQHRVLVPHTALSIKDLLKGNTGAELRVTQVKGSGQNQAVVDYDATMLGFPTQSSEELAATSPPGTGEKLPRSGDVVLLKTINGTAVVPLSSIESIAFKGAFKDKVEEEEFRNLLTLKLDWDSQKPAKAVDLGMMYLQRGIRWIPQYKIAIDGAGNAHVKLQATLINELTDLNDATVNLVVGVPSFTFSTMPDPISMQTSLATLSPYFPSGSRTVSALSNAMMSQVNNARQSQVSADEQTPQTTEGEGTVEASKSEDLFVYPVRHVTLKKGQRTVLPVCEFNLKYRDVYVLDMPFAPPPEMMQYHGGRSPSEVDRLLAAPKFMHKLRLVNSSPYPLTTAPALIIKDNRLLGQAMMTYTGRNSTGDLSVTTAVDLPVKKVDKEIARVPNAVTWQGDQYARVDLSGIISVVNNGTQASDLEIRRSILGKVSTADHNGAMEMVNVFEDAHEALYPDWWSWYNWPQWWGHFNGVGKVTWKLALQPKQSVDLGYKWSYYWR